ncbi:hypothetical protein ACR9VJ_04570 [Streptomyces sp. H49]|uniref:hypothetical protein n=1 Tax=Streptomyces sp. H49 TaxID=3444117 RepID=UPI003F4A8EED
MLLRQVLTGSADAHADFTSADSARPGATTIDLTATLLAHHADQQNLVSAGPRQRVLFEQISTYINAHLHDPGLTPGTVAAAHFISTRYLHRIFQQHGTTGGGVGDGDTRDGGGEGRDHP